jgi:hypothetical protein
MIDCMQLTHGAIRNPAPDSKIQGLVHRFIQPETVWSENIVASADQKERDIPKFARAIATA